jgi:hypothetical protein
MEYLLYTPISCYWNEDKINTTNAIVLYIKYAYSMDMDTERQTTSNPIPIRNEMREVYVLSP